MSPTILVIGATGNTGKGVVHNLPKLLESSNVKYRILGLTRSLESPVAQHLAKLPGVEMKEKDWTTIDVAWLQQEEVTRVFVVCHTLLEQFVEESALQIALLNAGVEYVVRVSTMKEYVSPSSLAYYGRAHWAIETMLSQPEFKNLKWTSLQPNLFFPTCLTTVALWAKEHRSNKKDVQSTLPLMLAADVPVALIDPADVGNVAAHLLALEDPTRHNQAKYILSGPEDVTGQRIVDLVQQHIGAKVEKVEYKFTKWLDFLDYPKLIPGVRSAFEVFWTGKCSLTGLPTSKEIMELAPPTRTVADAFKAMLEAETIETPA